MNQELTNKLFADFPNIYRGKDESIQANLMSFGFECGDGWYELIRDLSAKLEAMGGVKVFQVKEKFGGLRFYADGPDAAQELISQAEQRSYDICERCGKPGQTNTSNTGWVRTECPDCQSRREQS